MNYNSKYRYFLLSPSSPNSLPMSRFQLRLSDILLYTILLNSHRAIRSSWILLQELNQIYRPAIKSWRLNERMYVLVCVHAISRWSHYHSHSYHLIGLQLTYLSCSISWFSLSFSLSLSLSLAATYLWPSYLWLYLLILPTLHIFRYGALEGISKPALANELGQEQVHSLERKMRSWHLLPFLSLLNYLWSHLCNQWP